MSVFLWRYDLRFDTAAGITWAYIEYINYDTSQLLHRHYHEVAESPAGVGTIEVTVEAVSVTHETFYKRVRVREITDSLVIVDFIVEVSVPPFNELYPTYVGAQINYQEHMSTPPPPEIPSVPPPLPPPPIPIRPPEIPIEEPIEEPEPPPPCGDLDRETFHEFWVQWGHRVDRLAFEVPLDDGVDVPDLPEPWRSVWKQLTHHRIDVVFERKGVLYVAEIKPRLSIAAIGTAIVATTMIKQKYNVSRFTDVRPAVISQYGSPTLIQAAATHRVVIFLTRGIDGLYEPVALHDVIW